MKRIYTNNPVIAEQFTDSYIPDGVIVAEKEFIDKVLIPSLAIETKGKEIYLFKYPKPSESNKEVADFFKVPFPFCWINKGDYVLTFPSGYSRVESKESFERDYQEIVIL